MAKKFGPGINIQWPWSRLIIEGKKTIETRGYPIPAHYINCRLAIIETPGPRGKKEAGITASRIVGFIKFSGSFKYKTKSHWESDSSRHQVTSDSEFSFGKKNEVWAWEIAETSILRTPAPAPKRRGIVFTKNCDVS